MVHLDFDSISSFFSFLMASPSPYAYESLLDEDDVFVIVGGIYNHCLEDATVSVSYGGLLSF